ncbi:MAG: PqqD family protein [Deltaproteobacteria bacterium]|nr:PqqD family protein [Candidatus Zymogenaceae bacterium]
MKYLRMKPGLVLRTEEDGAFLFDPLDDILVCVNETGLEVVRSLEEGRSMDQIIERLTDLYPDIERESLIADVDSFVQKLVERGLAES